MRAPVVTALAAASGVLLATAGCGSDEPTPREEVRTVLTTFARATEDRDYETICTKVFAPRLLEGLRQISLPCQVALQKSLGQVEDPKLTVGAIEVDGTTARAEVRTSAAGQEPSTDTVELQQVDGSWRISALGGGESATPAATASPTATATPNDDTPGLDSDG